MPRDSQPRPNGAIHSEGVRGTMVQNANRTAVATRETMEFKCEIGNVRNYFRSTEI